MPTYSQQTTGTQRPMTYWAAEPNVETLASLLGDKIDTYYNYIYATGRVDVWRRCVRLLYGYDAEGGYKNSHYVTFGGEQGEMVQLRANIFRSFVRALHVTITGSPPTYTCQSTSDDAQSIEQVATGNAILDYYYNNTVEQASSDVAWYALVFGEGHAYTRWNFWKGKPVAVNQVQREDGAIDQQLVWNGDVDVNALKPEDVIRDVGRMDNDHNWLIACTLENKYDLAKRFPEHAYKILNTTPRARWRDIRTRMTATRDVYSIDSDVIPIYEFWHKKTDALPSGRYSLLIGSSVVIDEPMAYSDIPIHSMIPNMEIDSCQGYGETWDLLSIQQAIDSLVTQLVSNRENFGMRNVYVKTNSNLTPTMLSTGFRLLEGLEKPEVLDFGSGYAAEGIEFFEFLKGIAQLETGLNDTILGDASKSQSGDALEMLHSMAVQYNSGNQRAYSIAMKEMMGGVLECIRLYCKDQRLVSIVGKLKRTIAKAYTSADIDSLKGVQIEIGAAIMRTSMGRKQVADKLLQAQQINTEQYLEIQSTGRLEPVFERPMSQRITIDSENEKLRDGQPCLVLETDDHALHISEHSIILNDPDLRMNPQMLQAAMQHIMQHNQTWLQMSEMNPEGAAILVATNQQPHPGAQMAMQLAQQQAMQTQQPQPGGAAQPNPGQQPNPGTQQPAPTAQPDQAPAEAVSGMDGGDVPDGVPMEVQA